MEKQAFEQTVRQQSRRVYLIALSFTGSHADAEDVMQNVFLKLWQRAPGFADETHLQKWLTAVCVNECKSLLRSARRKKDVPLEAADALYTFGAPRDRSVFNAVMALPPKERAAIHLFYFEDLSVKEIARILGISSGAVKTRLSRARKILKENLGDDNG